MSKVEELTDALEILNVEIGILERSIEVEGVTAVTDIVEDNHTFGI